MQANASRENQAAYVKHTPHDLQNNELHCIRCTAMLTENNTKTRNIIILRHKMF